jgi:hypothetical protein
VGFISYSEGCNDDVNKAVWSALGWNPEMPVVDVLREFSRYYIGDQYTESFTQGLLALESNWRGPLLANEGVNTTLQQFQELERQASPQVKANWRFQQALFRAYYDAYTRSRLIYETGLEDRVMETLRDAARLGSRQSLVDADGWLNRASTEMVARDLRARAFELGDALFQSIRMQLTVDRHQAIGVDRGASLDTIDYPLNNRRWLQEQFDAIRGLKTEAKRLKAINSIVQWTNPGRGDFMMTRATWHGNRMWCGGCLLHKIPRVFCPPRSALRKGMWWMSRTKNRWGHSGILGWITRSH